MTARKTPKTSAVKKAPAKKAPTKKAAAKKAPARKAPGKDGPAKRAPAKKGPAKQAPGRPAAPAHAPSPEPAEAPKKARPAGPVSALDVNLGHVFALRPRVSTSFRQEDFRAAKHLLEEEGYARIEEAARAVVEKALSLTREAGGTPRGFKPAR
jgi:hypothetical protein